VPVPSYTAWWQRHIGVNNLPKVVTQLLSQVGFEPTTCWSQVQSLCQSQIGFPMSYINQVLSFVCLTIQSPTRSMMSDWIFSMYSASRQTKSMRTFRSVTTYKGCGGSDTSSDPSAAVGNWSSESESDSANGGPPWLSAAAAAPADWLLAVAAGTSAPKRTSWAASASSS